MWLILQNPQFRLLWFGSALNDVGLTMYMMVHGWLALSVTDSPFWVGATMGVNGVGMMGFGAFGGVLADRVDRRKLVVGTQAIEIAFSLALIALIFTGHVLLWHILAFALVEGAAFSVKAPTRMALAMDVVGRGNLLSAIAAGYATYTSMGIVTPLLGGGVVSAFHIGWAYVIIGAAYFLSAAVFSRMARPGRAVMSPASPWQDLKQGVRYVFSTPGVRTLILLVIISESFGWAHQSMLPVMARDVLMVGASGLGFMLATASGGAAVSTVLLSSMGDIRNKGRVMLLGLGGFGVFLVLFALSPWFSLSLAMLALAYASAMTYEAVVATLLQIQVPDRMRGRVLSFQTLTWGLAGVSGFHTGAIATAVGAPIAIAIGGGVMVLWAIRMLPSTSRFQERADEVEAGRTSRPACRRAQE